MDIGEEVIDSDEDEEGENTGKNGSNSIRKTNQDQENGVQITTKVSKT